MPRADTLSPETRFLGLFVGSSGCGKTVAECSFTEAGDVEVWDFDGRIRGILGAPWIDRKKIIYEPFPPDEKGMIDRLNKKMEAMVTMASINQPLPRTLILDSITTQTFAMLRQALPITHSSGSANEKKRGKYVGNVAMMGPEDYGFEATTTQSILSFFRSIPIQNIIVSGHIVAVYGKDPAQAGNDYAPSIAVGEKLALRDKIAEIVPIYFDHCFRFNKQDSGSGERFTVRFRGDLPIKTSYNELPYGEVDLTGKSFYKTMMNYIQAEREVVIA